MHETKVKQEMIRFGIAAASGILAGYYLDPVMGKRRRILLRDKLGKTSRNIRRQSELALRDMEQRTQGSFHELMARFTDQEFDDQIIQNRVRAVIGHYCSHPSAIHVEVRDRNVTLNGNVLKRDLMPLLWASSTVRGVKRVENHMRVHKEAGNVPDMQGEGKHRSFGMIQREYLPPSYRLGLGTIGAGLGIYGFIRRDSVGAGAIALGSLLMTRALVNKNLKRLLGIDAGPDVIHVKKTITINAPVAKVYELWKKPENFPSFMRNVHKVENLGDNHYRWIVKGPAGSEVEWTAVMQELEANKRLAWHTVPGSLIEQAGQLYFEDHDETTTVHIQLAYNPPAGAIGHLIAYLFRSDPKTDLDEDMIRMKSMIETGKRPHDAHSKSA